MSMTIMWCFFSYKNRGENEAQVQRFCYIIDDENQSVNKPWN